jgi:hypothetical protein
MYPTIEDIYSAMIETDRGVKEKVIIYDTGLLVSIQVDTVLDIKIMQFNFRKQNFFQYNTKYVYIIHITNKNF